MAEPQFVCPLIIKGNISCLKYNHGKSYCEHSGTMFLENILAFYVYKLNTIHVFHNTSLISMRYAINIELYKYMINFLGIYLIHTGYGNTVFIPTRYV